MNIIIGIIIGLFILMLLVVAHEFGHFIMARRSGVKVNEFGIGFPPRLVAWVKTTPEKHSEQTQDTVNSKTAHTSKSAPAKKWRRLSKAELNKPQDNLVFSLNLLPIGGFCSMDGESDADTRPGTMGAASYWSKTKILFGGVCMNWLVAAIILTILAFTGMPQFLPHQFYLGNDAEIIDDISGIVVENVQPDTPAANAGFAVGDQILAADEQAVITAQDVIDYNQQHAGQQVTYKVLRGNAEETLTAKLNPASANDVDTNAPPLLGVSMSSYGQRFIRSAWSAPIVGIGTTIQLTGETFRGLGEMVWNLGSGLVSQLSFNADTREAGRVEIGAAGDAVSGPIGILGVIFPAFAQTGLTNLLFLAALISVSLACMNVLPIPALDGGRWLLITIYKLRHKKLTKETEEKIVSRAFMALIVLIIFISVLDIIRLPAWQ